MDIRDAYFPMLETIRSEDYVIATYLVKTPENNSSLHYAVEMAVDQTTGTWTKVAAETDEVKAKHRARVIGVYELPNGESGENKADAIIQIAFPHLNFGHKISQLFATILGNNSSMGLVKLLDLNFPKEYIEGFPGCKLGVSGIRKVLGVYGRPLLCNMIKPCTGIAPQVGAKLAYQAALGGADMIKDDELLADTPFSPIQERVSVFMGELRKADEIKCEKTLYMLNITDRPDQMVEHALRAIDKGANALMINYMTVGFDAVRMVTEHKDIQVPVLGHCTMSGALSAHALTGVDVSLLVGKIPRMIGLDAVLIYAPMGRFLLEETKYQQIVNMHLQDFYHLKPVFPLPGGSIHPGVVRKIVRMTGHDCIISAGGGIHGHPWGSTAGAKAIRQAIDLCINGEEDNPDLVKDYHEYREAIKTWGKV